MVRGPAATVVSPRPAADSAVVVKSLDQIVLEMVENLRFEDAASLAKHLTAETELSGLRSKYQNAKDADELELALQLKKEIAAMERSLLSSAKIAELRSRASHVEEFSLAACSELPAMASYSLPAILEVARKSPVKAFALLKEGEELYEKLNAPASPTDSQYSLWNQIQQEALREICALQGALQEASGKSPAALKAFAEHVRVVKHVHALVRLFSVAMKCAFALEKFGQPSQADELRRAWRKLVVSGGWRLQAAETRVLDHGGVFNEPKCSVCWNFIAPLDSVACLVPDVASHVACANLCANRFPNQVT